MALDMSAVKQKREDLQRGGGYNADFDKLEKGDNVRRILPPKGDKKVFWAEGYLHFGLGDDGKLAVTCPDTFDDGEPCPICAYVEELKKSRSKEDKELADKIKKTKRTYISVLNRDDDEETPKVLSVGKQILQPIIDLICDPDYGDITDFEEGLDITIKKTGTGLNTEYSVTPKRKSSVACEDMSVEELQEALPDLESLFVRKSAEELQAILDGEDYEESDDDDEDSEEGEESGDYDDLTLDELEEICEERELKIPPRKTKLKLIALLTAADEEEAEEEARAKAAAKKKPAAKTTKASTKKSAKREPDPEPDDEDDSEDSEEDDDTMDEIQAALARRKGKK